MAVATSFSGLLNARLLVIGLAVAARAAFGSTAAVMVPTLSASALMGRFQAGTRAAAPAPTGRSGSLLAQ